MIKKPNAPYTAHIEDGQPMVRDAHGQIICTPRLKMYADMISDALNAHEDRVTITGGSEVSDIVVPFKLGEKRH